MSAIITIDARIQRALDFFNQDSLWFGFGKTSPWGDPDEPPPPDPELRGLLELVGLKKVITKHLVVPDEAGTIVFRGQNFRIISSDEAFDERCRWVYLETTVEYDELPLEVYRQIGVYSRVVPQSSVPPGQTTLVPSEIEDSGVLEYYANEIERTRTYDEVDTFRVVIEM